MCIMFIQINIYNNLRMINDDKIFSVFFNRRMSSYALEIFY